MTSFKKRTLINKLKDFYSVSLDELKFVSLLNREDTKFIFHQDHLEQILDESKPFYKSLDIKKERIFNYKTIYYDTDHFLFFNQHQNGSKKRFKIRVREYSNMSDIYFEIKIKNNKNKTIKERYLMNGNMQKLEKSVKQKTEEIIGLSLDKLKPKLNVDFSRITLVDKNHSERLTIDTNLKVRNEKSEVRLNSLVIVEIKQGRYNPKSNFMKILRKKRIHETKFSKYCIGLIHINKHLKYNRFKPQLLKLNQVLETNNKV